MNGGTRAKASNLHLNLDIPTAANGLESSKLDLQIPVLIMANIASSVSLILLNKNLMVTHKFRFLLFLSACHFFATMLFSRTAVRMKFFAPKRDSMPSAVVWIMAIAGTCSICFMNFNLNSNSVGFYQMTKLMCIPYMVLYGRSVNGQKVSLELLISLVLILSGVGIATVTDMQVNATGLVYGVLAVVFTAQFQIWQGSKQSEFKLNPMQITDAVMPYQFFVCAMAALLLETAFLGRVESIESVLWTRDLVTAILMTCVGAIAVNILTYALIGKTSAVTFQVIGHLKTVLTIGGGMYLFSSSSQVQDHSKMMANLAGILVAMFGMVLYGDIKANAVTNSTILCRLTGWKTLWTMEF